MSKGGKFSVYEGVLFITIVLISKILYTSPSVVVKQTGTSSWFATIVSCATAIICFLLVYVLLNRFPGKSLEKVFEAVLGKILGKTLGIIFSAYILYFSASTLRGFVEMIKVFNLPDTPPSVIMITFMAVSILISYKGLESIVRISCLSFYFTMFGLFVILCMAYPHYNIDYIKPYFGYGIKETLSVGILRSSAYEEVLTLSIIVGSLHSVKDVRKIGVISLVLSGGIFSICFLYYLMTYQYTMGSENLSGLFQLSRIIYYSRYLQRVESIFIFIWVVSSLVTTATAFYLSVRVYCQSFDIPEHRPILIPFTLLKYVIALQPKNISELININLKFIRQYSLSFIYGIPILVLIIALIFKKKEEKSGA